MRQPDAIPITLLAREMNLIPTARHGMLQDKQVRKMCRYDRLYHSERMREIYRSRYRASEAIQNLFDSAKGVRT